MYTAPANTPPAMGPAQYTCEHQAHHNFRYLPNLTRVMINHLINRTTLKMQYSVCKLIKCRITSCIITNSLYTPFRSSVHSTDLVALDVFSTSYIVLFMGKIKQTTCFFLTKYKPCVFSVFLNRIAFKLNIRFNFKYHYVIGDCSSTVAKALRYKSEGRWFDSKWCHWNFSLT